MSDILARRAPRANARLAYGPDKLQIGELRLPVGAGRHPVFVGIHGGYWRARYGLEYFGHVCAALTAAGAATWNIEYRRLGNRGGGWPGLFLDVGQACDHLRALAHTYPLDLSRVVAIGHSAGGQLALWAAGRHRIAQASPLHALNPLAVGGVVALAGVCDLRQAWELRLSDAVTDQLLGGSPERWPERYAAASPAELLPLGVPQLLIHGTADEHVPYALSREYATAALAAGDPATLLTLPGAGHFGLVDPQAQEWPRVLAATQALLRSLAT